MASETIPTANKAIRRVTDLTAQQAETYRYWQSRTPGERMDAVADIVRDGYKWKGIDIDAQRPPRTLVRIECPWS